MRTPLFPICLAVSFLSLANNGAFADDKSKQSSREFVRLVKTSDGKFRCPAAAYNSGIVDTTLCARIDDSRREDSDDDHPTVVCVPNDSSSSENSSSTSVSSSNSSSKHKESCSIPTALHDQRNLDWIKLKCVGGGTRSVTGGMDDATGKVDITITLKDCVDAHKATHNGSAAMKGTILAKAGAANVFTIDETKTISDNITYSDGTTLLRTCTITRVGELDMSGRIFTGIATRNGCKLEGKFKFKEDFGEVLLNNSSALEEF